MLAQCWASVADCVLTSTPNPLSPHDALKHHFTSLKTDLIVQQQRDLEQNFHETNLPIHRYMAIFCHFSPTSNHSLQVENCDSNSRLVVDGDDNGKFRLERVLKG